MHLPNPAAGPQDLCSDVIHLVGEVVEHDADSASAGPDAVVVTAILIDELSLLAWLITVQVDVTWCTQVEF